MKKKRYFWRLSLLYDGRIVWRESCQLHSKVPTLESISSSSTFKRFFKKPRSVSWQLQRVCMGTLFQISAYLLVMRLFYTSCLYASLLLTNYSLRIYMDERRNPHITMETELMLNDSKWEKCPGFSTLAAIFYIRCSATRIKQKSALLWRLYNIFTNPAQKNIYEFLPQRNSHYHITMLPENTATIYTNMSISLKCYFQLFVCIHLHIPLTKYSIILLIVIIPHPCC